MFILWLMIIQAENQPFRKKISKLENEIKAYSLLERKKTETKEKVKKTNNKISLKEAPQEKYQAQQTKKEKNILKALKIKEDKYWNENEKLIEY